MEGFIFGILGYLYNASDASRTQISCKIFLFS